MKTNQLNSVIFAMMMAAVLFTSACRDKVFEKVTYTANVPEYMGFEEFRGSVKSSDAQQLSNPGKIYFKDNLLFINEMGQGIHVVDNSNPASPQIISFITIPGNYDLAIRGNILFADSYIDLVALDISDPLKPFEVDRLKDAFPNVLPPFDQALPIADLDFTKGVVVSWKIREHTETIERGGSPNKSFIAFDGSGVARFASQEVSIGSGGSAATGISGSMARFTIFSDFLYSVHNNKLRLFNITGIPGISTEKELPLNRVVETIFPYDNKLFLGTTTGMLVYGLSNPANPVFISAFEHINSCDPVVVEGRYAYVTLRSGNECFGFTNQLEVVDLINITSPQLVKTYPMYNPHGLGIDNGKLFICDGDAGLKVYNASDPTKIDENLIVHFPGIKSYDVIPLGGVLMMIGADGLFQYDYTNPENLVLLSSLPISRNR
jgi:hypothetical protein